jgi:hypothetical protein
VPSILVILIRALDHAPVERDQDQEKHGTTHEKVSHGTPRFEWNHHEEIISPKHSALARDHTERVAYLFA